MIETKLHKVLVQNIYFKSIQTDLIMISLQSEKKWLNYKTPFQGAFLYFYTVMALQ